ncbi:hypothetical protein [Paenibacillus sp. SER-28]
MNYNKEKYGNGLLKGLEVKKNSLGLYLSLINLTGNIDAESDEDLNLTIDKFEKEGVSFKVALDTISERRAV